MKYFEVVRQDANKEGGVLKESEVKLRCKAIKKFIPYDGFYPAERTVQIAQQFSSSLGPYTNIIGNAADKPVAFRTFLKPFFAPGIVYNTIKSGIAVDYPILTGSHNTAKLADNEANAAQRFLTNSFRSYFFLTPKTRQRQTPHFLQEPESARIITVGIIEYHLRQ